MVAGTHDVADTEVIITWKAHIKIPVGVFMGGIESEASIWHSKHGFSPCPSLPSLSGLSMKKSSFRKFHSQTNCMKSILTIRGLICCHLLRS